MTKFTNHVNTIDELLLSCKKLNSGKIITIVKQNIGTPFFVHVRRILGARPSRARPYRLRVAQYVYVFPAEKMEVTIRALTM